MIAHCDKSPYTSDADFMVGIAGDPKFEEYAIISESVVIGENIKPVEISVSDVIAYHSDDCPSSTDGIPDHILKFSVNDVYTLKTISGQQLVPVTLHFSATHPSGDIVNFIAHESITLN